MRNDVGFWVDLLIVEPLVIAWEVGVWLIRNTLYCRIQWRRLVSKVRRRRGRTRVTRVPRIIPASLDDR